jgi:hypothetical protein
MCVYIYIGIYIYIPTEESTIIYLIIKQLSNYNDNNHARLLSSNTIKYTVLSPHKKSTVDASMFLENKFLFYIQQDTHHNQIH